MVDLTRVYGICLIDEFCASVAVHPVQDGAKAVRPVQGRDSLVLRRPHPVLDGRDDWDWCLLVPQWTSGVFLKLGC